MTEGMSITGIGETGEDVEASVGETIRCVTRENATTHDRHSSK